MKKESRLVYAETAKGKATKMKTALCPVVEKKASGQNLNREMAELIKQGKMMLMTSMHH